MTSATVWYDGKCVQVRSEGRPYCPPALRARVRACLWGMLARSEMKTLISYCLHLTFCWCPLLLPPPLFSIVVSLRFSSSSQAALPSLR